MTAGDDKALKSGREPHDAQRSAIQRRRSIAIAVSLVVLVVLFYIATIVKMGGGLADKAGG